MDPDEVEYLAEKRDVGPLKGGIPCRVPLWFGVNLKQQQKCVILPPDWMNVDTLEDLLNAEKQSKNFVKMPSDHYMIEAKLLLGCASDNIQRSDEIRTLIKDIWDVRMSKIQTSMDALIREGASFAALDNLTMLEINSIRPLLPHALDQLYRLKTQQEDEIQSQNTTATFNISSRN